MEQSTLIIIQCAVFAVLLLAMFYYFNRKMMYQLSAIESLQNQILMQQKSIETHERLFRQILGSSSSFFPEHHAAYPSSPPMAPPPRHQACPITPPAQVSPQAPPSTPQNPLFQMAPMMSGLLGVLGSMGNVAGGFDEPEDSPPVSPIDTSEIDEELKKELEELNNSASAVKEIKEGRIDTSENVSAHPISNKPIAVEEVGDV